MMRPWHDGTRAILFEPHELIERLAALVPKPRINLLLDHGVLGPSARLRHAAVAAARGSSPSLAGETLAPNPHATSGSVAELDAKRGETMSNLGTAARPLGDGVDLPGRFRSRPRPHMSWAELLRRTLRSTCSPAPAVAGACVYSRPSRSRRWCRRSFPTSTSQPSARSRCPRDPHRGQRSCSISGTIEGSPSTTADSQPWGRSKPVPPRPVWAHVARLPAARYSPGYWLAIPAPGARIRSKNLLTRTLCAP